MVMPTFARPLLALLLGLLAAPVPPAAAEEDRPSVAQAVAQFETVVFGAEMDSRMAQEVVARWQGPVTIKLQGRYDKEKVNLFVKHLREVANLTQVKFNVVAGPKHADTEAQIDVIFIRRDDDLEIPRVPADLLARLRSEGRCFFLSFRKPESRLVKAVIVANSALPKGLLDHCLLEELTQSMGLPNDSTRVRPSIFSDGDTLTELAPVDTWMVKALYDPRMQPGLRRAEALRVAEEVFRGMAGDAEE